MSFKSLFRLFCFYISYFKKYIETPFGQLPTLEVDGKVATQSLAICRYVAKLAKLTGENSWEDLVIDSVVDTINDLRASEYGIFI